MMNAPTLRDGGVASARGWVTVALLLVAATLVSMLLDQHVALMSQAMIYVLAVVIASYRLRWIGSVVCAVGAVTALNFFFVPPRAGPWSLKIANSSSGWRPCTGREHVQALCALLAQSLWCLRQRDPQRRIKSSAANGLPLVRADPVLLARMLGNLLDIAEVPRWHHRPDSRCSEHGGWGGCERQRPGAGDRGERPRTRRSRGGSGNDFRALCAW